MSNIVNYFVNTIIHPKKTFEKILNDPHGMSSGFKISLIMGILYTISIIGFCVTKKSSFIPPFLIIPADIYYFWEIFFAYPVSLLNYILAVGVLYLLGMLLKGNSTYNNTFSVMGYAICIPILPMWIVDTVLVILFLTGIMQPTEWDWLITHVTFWKIFNVGYSLLVFIWQFILFSIAAAVTQKLSFWKSVFSGAVTVLVFWVIWAVFIR